MIVKDNTPSALEELLNWCEKHLNSDEYQLVEESRSYSATIYFDMYNNEEHPFMCFNDKGTFISAVVLTDEDRVEHIRDLEATERERGTFWE